MSRLDIGNYIASCPNQPDIDPTAPAETVSVLDPRGEKHTISIKDAQFVRYLLDTDNLQTYGNATSSYLLSHPGCKRSTAAVEGSKLLHKPVVQYAIAQARDAMGNTVKVRTAALDSILTGRYIQRTVKTVKAGSTIRTTITERSPSAAEVRGAADILSKIDGTYTANNVRARLMTTELQGVFRDTIKGQRAGARIVSDDPATTTPPDATGTQQADATDTDTTDTIDSTPLGSGIGEGGNLPARDEYLVPSATMENFCNGKGAGNEV